MTREGICIAGQGIVLFVEILSIILNIILISISALSFSLLAADDASILTHIHPSIQHITNTKGLHYT